MVEIGAIHHNPNPSAKVNQNSSKDTIT